MGGNGIQIDSVLVKLSVTLRALANVPSRSRKPDTTPVQHEARANFSSALPLLFPFLFFIFPCIFP